jgi:hypothetical protein
LLRVLYDLANLTPRQVDGSDPVVGGSGCITWHSTWETTGEAEAGYALYDGPADANQNLMYVTLSEGQSTRDFIGIHSLSFIDGLFYVLESGSVLGSLHVWTNHRCEEIENMRQLVLEAEVASILGNS